jgi:hypothetical protein
MSDLNHELNEEIKKFQQVYNEMLIDERWQQSPFLKIIHAKMSILKEQLANLIENSDAQSIDINTPLSSKAPDDNFQKFFIYLYTAEGKKLDAWQRMVESLDKHYISRPIYENEFDAQYAAIHAPVFFNAGYVGVWVDKKFINTNSDTDDFKDKFGHTLISLKDRAIVLSRIDSFWNNYAQYSWTNSKLTFSKLVERLQK